MKQITNRNRNEPKKGGKVSDELGFRFGNGSLRKRSRQWSL
jgi:hypothetical protein